MNRVALRRQTDRGFDATDETALLLGRRRMQPLRSGGESSSSGAGTNRKTPSFSPPNGLAMSGRRPPQPVLTTSRSYGGPINRLMRKRWEQDPAAPARRCATAKLPGGHRSPNKIARASWMLRPAPPPMSGIAQTSWRGTSLRSAWQRRLSFWKSADFARMPNDHFSQ
jgi:hypothetical protein